jgi:hypothetical protein
MNAMQCNQGAFFLFREASNVVAFQTMQPENKCRILNNAVA